MCPRCYDVLQELDPLLSSTVVVEPFPDATLRDVLTDIHGALGVGSAESREHRAALDSVVSSDTG
jgi:hypothetical protein